jgi:MFS family permease
MNYTMLVVARLVGGIAIGMLSVITPIYISEISPPEIRGSLLVLSKSLHSHIYFSGVRTVQCPSKA